MTIYGEYLFLENGITGFVILLLTGSLCSRKRSKSGLLLGALMCGAYSFMLFVPLIWPLALVIRILFSLIVIVATFGYGGKSTYLKTVAVFYIVSFLMGGITIGLMHVAQVPGVTSNGAVYLHGVTYLQVSAGVLATWILGSWFAGFMREKLCKEKVFTDVTVEIAEKQWEMRAFVDTGNFLRDPVSGRPAAVVSASCGQRILDELKEGVAERGCIIPYCSVGQKGVLRGLRPDRVLVGGKVVGEIVLAISKEDFACWKGRENYQVLLQQQIIEEGVLEHAESLYLEH